MFQAYNIKNKYKFNKIADIFQNQSQKIDIGPNFHPFFFSPRVY